MTQLTNKRTMTKTKASTFSLSSWVTTLVALAIWSVARAEATGLVRNSLRRGPGVADLVS
jgi:type IV secretory pathway TrbD component